MKLYLSKDKQLWIDRVVSVPLRGNEDETDAVLTLVKACRAMVSVPLRGNEDETRYRVRQAVEEFLGKECFRPLAG